MAYANATWAGSDIRIPHVPMPIPRWLRLSRRTRALVMMGVMCSPAFLGDTIEYCVKRLRYSDDQIAAMRSPEDTILKHIQIFHVACADASAIGQWTSYAAARGWPAYPQAGPTCFRPDVSLLGVVGLKTFNVACPTMVFSAPDQRRWVAYAADHGWTDYSQAGPGCVDP